MKRIKKENIISLVIVFVAILAMSFFYFYPANVEGRKPFQMDGLGAAGTAQDVRDYKEETGERSFWTGSLFGGMPMYQISPSYPSTKPLNITEKVYRLKAPFDIMPGDSYLLFTMLIGFFIFMRAWGFRRLTSLAGSIMWTFSSYFLILIDAGHIWKLMALSYIPPTIGGLVLIFKRRKYLLGLAVTALFAALQIQANHIQMSYYFAFLMVALVIAWAVEAGRKKDWAHFGKALGMAAIAAVLGIGANASTLYHTYQYSKETMRGGSELTATAGEPTETTSSGLDKDYITQWSYGIDEMMTFLIPDAKGGYTTMIGNSGDKEIYDVKPEYQGFVMQQNRYWGDQPFTAGPVYVGAFVLALFFLGVMIVKGPEKWALLIVTILTVMLSWGHNMMWLSSLFIDYFPLYNKFRTVSSILVVAEFTIPLLAIMGLIKFIKTDRPFQKYKKESIIALALTGGVALLMALFPSIYGKFLSAQEHQLLAPYILKDPQLGVAVDELRGFRMDIFQADAWRSLLFIVLGFGVLLLYHFKKINKKVVIVAVAVLSLIDLWSVDKRYLNDSKYYPMTQLTDKSFPTTPADLFILQDTTSYRVMNLSVNTFNDATTSYHHQSIGGYHAAKLQRYQDVIEGYLSKLNTNVVRALNTKYYIVPDSVQGVAVTKDTLAYGNAWFVENVVVANSPDEEFKALGEVPLNKTAVLHKTFAEKIPSATYSKDSLANIELIHHSPNELVYKTSNSQPGLAVFSEVYYPDGWQVSIDGKAVDLLRADYILRALPIPAGNHQVVMRFDPTSLHRTELFAKLSVGATLALLFIAVPVCYFVKRGKKKKEEV